MAYPATSIGNQFPSAGYKSNVDFHNAIDVPLDAIRGVYLNSPVGYIAGQKTTVAGNYATAATVVSAAFSYTLGRQYLICAYFQGVQNTSTGVVNVALSGTGIPANYLYLAAVSSATTAWGSAIALFAPGSSGSTTANLVASTSAATFTIAAGATIAVFDMGT